MEDVDAAFTQAVVNRGAPTISDDDESTTVASQNFAGSMHQTQSRLSLSGLLNAIDGVGAQEGRILFATTNHYGALDTALCRPGRMDCHIKFRLASSYQAEELFKRFYLPEDESLKSKASVHPIEGMDETTAYESDVDQGEPSPITGLSNCHRAPSISKQELDQLAKDFAALVPSRKVSMAALQGYLMTYKTQPVQATTNVAAWVKKELTGSTGAEAEE